MPITHLSIPPQPFLTLFPCLFVELSKVNIASPSSLRKHISHRMNLSCQYYIHWNSWEYLKLVSSPVLFSVTCECLLKLHPSPRRTLLMRCQSFTPFLPLPCLCSATGFEHISQLNTSAYPRRYNSKSFPFLTHKRYVCASEVNSNSTPTHRYI